MIEARNFDPKSVAVASRRVDWEDVVSVEQTPNETRSHEMYVLSGGATLRVKIDSMFAVAVSRLLQGDVPEDKFNSIFPDPRHRGRFERWLERSDLGIVLSNASYHLEKLSDGPRTQGDSTHVGKEIPVENFNAIKDAIGLEFTILIISNIAYKTLKRLPRDLKKILNLLLQASDVRLDSKIKATLVDPATTKQIADYIFTGTLEEEWYQGLDSPNSSPKQRQLRAFCTAYKKDGITSPERIVNLFHKYFRIFPPTSSPARKSPKAAVRS